MSIAEQDPNAAKVARETAGTDEAATLARQEPQPRRGPALPARPGPLPRRHQAARACSHAAIVRSPHAHARIVAIDTSKAEALPGVVRVVTGKDVAEHAAPLPSFGAGPIVQDMIAIEKVRHYGETVAAVIAEDRYVAEDACDLIEVDLRAAAGRARPVRGPGGGRAARARGARDERRLRAHVLLRRGRQGVRGCRPHGHAPSSTGRARPACRWTRTARSATTTRGTGVVTIYANSMNFTYFLWLIAASLKIPAEQAPARARRRRRQLRLEVLHAQGADASQGSSRCSSASR